VLGELGQVYDQRVAQLRQAGIEPRQVISWRQRLTLATQPVTQMGRTVSIDDQFTLPFASSQVFARLS
jgi:hypothetical protein